MGKNMREKKASTDNVKHSRIDKQFKHTNKLFLIHSVTVNTKNKTKKKLPLKT